MSKTVSFVAREELAEWLESQADAEMKTVSSLVQDIVAEKYREVEDAEPTDQEAEPTNQEAEPSNSIGEDRDDEPDVFDRHPDKWYRPDSIKHEYAVYTPDDGYNAQHSNNQRYYKTREGAAERLRDWYDE